MRVAIYVVAVGTVIGTPALPSGHKFDALVIFPLQILILFDLNVFKLEAPAGRRESKGTFPGFPLFPGFFLLPSGLRDGDDLAGPRPGHRDETAVLFFDGRSAAVDAPLESVVVIEAAALLLLPKLPALLLPEVVLVMVVMVVLVLDDRTCAVVAKADLLRGKRRTVKEVVVVVAVWVEVVVVKVAVAVEVNVAIGVVALTAVVRGRRVGRRRVREERLLPVGLLVARAGRGRVGDVVVLGVLVPRQMVGP